VYQDELIDVARTLYGEARGAGLLDRLGVLAVIRERTLRPGWWGRGWSGVVKSPWQFSCWSQHDDAHKRNFQSMMEAEVRYPKLWQGFLALASYAEHMTDRDVMALFHVSEPDEFPTHYFSAPLTDPPKAWGTNIREIQPRWPSVFRFFVVYDGRPPRQKNT